jgi:ribose transport system permease protein
MRMPAFRRRMMKQIPRDEWLYPSMNHGCVVKVSEQGEVLETLWDAGATVHATITSMREHDGYLYIGGLENNRIGRIKLDPSRRDEGHPAAPRATVHTG